MADLPPKTTAMPWNEPTASPSIEKKDQAAEPSQDLPSPAAVCPEEKQAQLPVLAKPDRGPLLRKIAGGLVGFLFLAALAWGVSMIPVKSLFKSKTSPPAPLSLLDVASERRFENGAMQLVVDGRIFNETEKSQTVPAIGAAAIGPDGKTLQSWKIEPPTPTIEPKASITFHSVITTPEGSIAAVNLKFAPAETDPQKNTK